MAPPIADASLCAGLPSFTATAPAFAEAMVLEREELVSHRKWQQPLLGIATAPTSDAATAPAGAVIASEGGTASRITQEDESGMCQ